MLSELPIEKVAVKDLHALVTSKGTFPLYFPLTLTNCEF
jgi:hypothetical protein